MDVKVFGKQILGRHWTSGVKLKQRVAYKFNSAGIPWLHSELAANLNRNAERPGVEEQLFSNKYISRCGGWSYHS